QLWGLVAFGGACCYMRKPNEDFVIPGHCHVGGGQAGRGGWDFELPDHLPRRRYHVQARRVGSAEHVYVSVRGAYHGPVTHDADWRRLDFPLPDCGVLFGLLRGTLARRGGRGWVFLVG